MNGMEKRSGWTGMILLVALSACCAGCTSYRFQGTIRGTESESPRGRYRIVEFKMTVPKMDIIPIRDVDDPYAIPDPWSIPQCSYKRNRDAIIRDLEIAVSPTLCSDPNAEPVSVKVISAGDTKSGIITIFFPYLISLGILPAHLATESRCDVTVALVRDPSQSRSISIEYRSDTKVSVFSPIGAISFDPVPASSFRTASGIMTAPHIDKVAMKNTQDVFIEALAKGIAACLADMERVRTALAAPVTVSTPPPAPVVSTPPPVPAVPQPSVGSSISVQISELKALRDAGTISKEEYEKLLLRAVEQNQKKEETK
ncbi:MAG: SHOCT domain-containing protein [Kiritimatiellae bacterium]|nr:SHOCT domain-containing protein [Kiritimatiellia bacterium]